MRCEGELPENVHFKLSAHAGHSNPASAKLLQENGLDSLNPVRDLQIPMIAAIRNACDIQKLMNESNLKNVFHAICGDREIMTGQDMKNFVFHDAVVHEHILNEYFDQIGMKIDDSITFDDFFNI